ncbi:MAG: SDR family oxidoreductase [Verrucomicrobiota bacterium]|jgi:NAD(P)-dependent dehydrogenase (short-subunit alcohol dehydrogenase family)
MGEPYTLITGASSGFGRSIALKLAPHRSLILVGRNGGSLEAVRSAGANPERHLLWVRDLSRLEGIADELTSLLAAKNIGIEHFIHSAGITGDQLVRAVETEFVTKVFNVNFFSALEIIRPLAQRRVNKGALRTITFVSSISSKLGGKGYSVYCASKGALDALARALAVELGPAVRVNSVLPGIVETGMTKQYFTNPDFLAAVQATYPLGFGRPEDIADAVEFLSSERARWITGQELIVDGGKSSSY